MKIVYLAPLILAGCAPVIPAPLPPAQPAASVVQPVPTTPSVQTQALKPKPRVADRVPVVPRPKPARVTEQPDTSDSTANSDTSSSQDTQPKATGASLETCKEGSWWGLIGRPRSAASIVSEPKRVYTEGDPVTMDDRPERTNIVLDAEGKIAKVTCG